MNNNDIKNEIIALLQNQNTDITDPDIQDKINGLLLLSSYKKFNNIKGVGIRILSENEYNKYIINGTCDGSVINNDINVFHHNAYPILCYYQFNTPRSDTFIPNPPQGYIGVTHSSSEYWENTPRRYTAFYAASKDICISILQNNNINKNSNESFNVEINWYGSPYDFNPRNISNEKKIITTDFNLLKTDNKISNTIDVGWPPVLHYTEASCLRLTINYYISFRPVFIIKDTNKSIDLFQ